MSNFATVSLQISTCRYQRWRHTPVDTKSEVLPSHSAAEWPAHQSTSDYEVESNLRQSLLCHSRCLPRACLTERWALSSSGGVPSQWAKEPGLASCRALPWNSPSFCTDSSSASQEIASILWHPKVHHRAHNSPPRGPILSHINPLKTERICFI
jgi:hypothetical protein